MLLLQLLDSEALYTFVGALKPISVGMHTVRRNSSAKIIPEQELTQITPALCCADIETILFPRQKTFGGASYIDLAVYSKQGVARIVKSQRPFFAGLEIAPETPPLAILEKLETAPPADANRALGYLYGYPAYAVEDFCTRKFGKKKVSAPSYFEVPTFSGKFAYPAPRGEKAHLEDVVLRESARVILAEYKRRRERYIGEGRKGAIELIRDWFDDGNGRCSPENARYR